MRISVDLGLLLVRHDFGALPGCSPSAAAASSQPELLTLLHDRNEPCSQKHAPCSAVAIRPAKFSFDTLVKDDRRNSGLYTPCSTPFLLTAERYGKPVALKQRPPILRSDQHLQPGIACG